MLVKISKLKKDDNIMLCSYSKFIFAQVIREPTLRWKRDMNGNKVPAKPTWGDHRDEQLYSNVKCRVKTKIVSRPSYNANNHPITWKEYDNTLEDYNDEKYFDLNFRDIWLIDK